MLAGFMSCPPAAITTGRSLPHNLGMTYLQQQREEVRKLAATVSDEDADDEARERAGEELSLIAAAWRGYPGQRRRGELPAGVETR